MIPNLHLLETPAVLIDQARAEANIKAYQQYCNQHGLNVRPHIKTHKLPLFAQAQLAAGAVGITCQKISEAEVMAAHGIRDILITYNILGAAKLARLLTLSRQVDHLAVVADSEEVLQGLSNTFAGQAKALEVMIECDTGGGRCGVQSPEAAVALAAKVQTLPGLHFRGLMTYPGGRGTAQVQAFMSAALAQLTARAIPCPVISSGGSPDMWRAHEAPVVTEYRIGTYIYNDRSLVVGGVCGWEHCALTVLATVVSVPTPHRAIIDAGSKILSSDLLGLQGYGAVQGRPDLHVKSLSEEHGTVIAQDGGEVGLKAGDRVQIIPNHCCVVSNLVNSVVLYEHAGGFRVEAVAARGCVV